MKRISYSGYRFPPEIIQQAIWLYLRFTLSLRDVEDLLAETRHYGVLRVHSALDKPLWADDRSGLA
jgi:transposase-like protein